MSIATRNPEVRHRPMPLHEGRSRPMEKVSVVLPAKNEAKNLPWVLGRMPKFVDEIVLVDGLSVDGTVEVAKSLHRDVVVVHETAPGKGHAVRAGIEAASGDAVVMLDADGSMDPKEMTRYLDALEWGFDVAKGSRFLPGGGTDDMTPLRKAGNFGLTALSNTLYRTTFTDLCYGYLAFRRNAVRSVPLTAEGFEIEMELLARAVRAGLSVVEVPSFEADRLHGNSNLNTFRDGWRVLRTMVRDRVRRPPKPRLQKAVTRRQRAA